MTIDEAIELHRKEATILTNGENHQIAERLTELKAYRNYKDLYEQGRADAIDEHSCKTCVHWKQCKCRENYCEVFDWQSKGNDFCSFHELKEQTK